MVQVLPHVPQFGELLAGQLGQAAGNIGSAYGRQTFLEKGLKDLEGATTQKGLGSALVRLSSRVPGLEKAIGPLFDALSKQLNVGVPGSEGEGGIPQTGGIPGIAGVPSAAGSKSPLQHYTSEQKPATSPSRNPALEGIERPQMQREEAPTPTLQAGVPITLGSLVPINETDYVTPEQSRDAVEKVRKAGGDWKDLQERINLFNKGKIDYNDLINTNVEKQSANVQRQLAFEDQIRDKLSRQLDPATPESDKNIFYKWVSEEAANPKNRDFTSAFQKVSQKIQNFKKNRDTVIGSIPQGNGNPALQVGLTPKQIASIGKGAKPFLDADPLAYNIAEEAFVQKGNTIFDAAKTLKPLDKNIKGIVDSVKSEKTFLGGSPIWDPTRPPPADAHKLIEKLDKNWTDDISLLNIYTELASKGWNPFQITETLDALSQRFNPQQQVERAQLSESPLIPSRYLL